MKILSNLPVNSSALFVDFFPSFLLKNRLNNEDSNTLKINILCFPKDHTGYTETLFGLLLDSMGLYVLRLSFSKYTAANLDDLFMSLLEDIKMSLENIRKLIFGMPIFIILSGFDIMLDCFIYSDENSHQEAKLNKSNTIEQTKTFIQILRETLTTSTPVNICFVSTIGNKLSTLNLVPTTDIIEATMVTEFFYFMIV